MKRCVIVAGAKIHNYDFVRSYLKEDDYFIFCDSGLNHLDALGVKPDMIVGDFDSYHEIPKFENLIVLPTVKDDTDSVFAVKCGLEKGFEEFLLIGVIGGRFDHSLGNISILLNLDSLGKTGLIVDDYSEMQILSGKELSFDDSYSYFSLLAIDGEANGVKIENAKYLLENGTITGNYAYGVSNETLEGKVTKVSVKSGRLLLVKSVKSIIPLNIDK